MNNQGKIPILVLGTELRFVNDGVAKKPTTATPIDQSKDPRLRGDNNRAAPPSLPADDNILNKDSNELAARLRENLRKQQQQRLEEIRRRRQQQAQQAQREAEGVDGAVVPDRDRAAVSKRSLEDFMQRWEQSTQRQMKGMVSLYGRMKEGWPDRFKRYPWYFIYHTINFHAMFLFLYYVVRHDSI